MVLFLVLSVFHLVGNPGEPVGENEKARHPETDENAEAFTIGAIVAGGGEPCDDRGNDRQEPQVEADVRNEFQVILVATGANRLDVFFDIALIHRKQT